MAESQVAVADKALKKLEDQLTCAVCLDDFKQPKMLNCFHVFCEQCLQRLVVQEKQGQVSLRCPTCRRSTLLPSATSVSGLQSAFHIHHLLEIQDALKKMKEPKSVQCEKCKKVSRVATSFCRDCGQFICATCADVHANWEDFSSHEVVSVDQLQSEVSKHVPPKKVTFMCSKHKDQQLRLYCETCEDLICHDCTVRVHKGHQYDLISDTFEEHKADIKASLGPIRKQKSIVKEKLKGLNARHCEVSEQRARVKTDVHREIQSFIDILRRREAELVNKLEQVAQAKLKNLEAQRDEMERILAHRDSCLSFVTESLRTGCEEEIVKMRKRVVEQIEDMTAEFNEDNLSPCEEADIVFMTSLTFANDCGLVGDIVVKASPDKSYAIGKGLEKAVVNEKSSAFMYTLDCHKNPCPTNSDKITCELVSEMNTSRANGKVRQIKDNQYEISYRPTSGGRHQLHIKIDGKHIKGSPFAVTVRRPIEKLGTPIKIITGVECPWGVAVNKKGEIIVADSAANRVSIFSHSGEKLRSFGSIGSGQGQFSGPRCVAVDDDSNILVADAWNHRIQKFTEDGKFITAVGSHRNKSLQFNIPTGIAIHPVSKKMYVTESLNYRIQILNPDLTSHSMFGSKGSGKGQFNEPRGIAFDSEQNVYVGENRSDTIVQVFSSSGDHLRSLGETKLNCPHDVAIDSNDTIYVCDTDNHQICIFNSQGELLRSFGTKGKLPGQFEHPYGIAVDKSGLIYVSDRNNGRVQIF